MKRIVRKEKRYDIDWLRNGFCYRTTMDCPWSAVLEAKRVAKMLGEKIAYAYSYTRNNEIVVKS
jgi:hypothetical protein